MRAPGPGPPPTRLPPPPPARARALPALCPPLRSPLHLRRRLRSTNLLERSLGEVQRRVRVIGRFPGETSCLSLCWAVLDLVIAGARGLGLSDLDREHLRRLQTERQIQQTKVALTA